MKSKDEIRAAIVDYLDPHEPSRPFVGELRNGVLCEDYKELDNDTDRDELTGRFDLALAELIDEEIIEAQFGQTGEEHALASALQHPEYMNEGSEYDDLKA
jgi:hypothetical protein